MRKAFVAGGLRYQAKKECPWACKIVRVEGGWMAFESWNDFYTWKNQKYEEGL